MRRSGTVVVMMIAMLVGGVPGVSAQTLSEGTRVRVTTPEARLRGTLTSIDAEAFTLALETGGLLTIRRDSVERLDVSAGRKGNAKKGFLIAASIYAVLGATEKECVSLDHPTKPCPAQNAVMLGLAGGLVGALIGHFIKSDRWVPVDSGPQITLTLPKHGIGAQVKVGW